MLDKDLYDSRKSRMELYMQNREHERMILELVENGPLIWPTVEENGVTRTKKYVELSAAEKIQVDCDMKATDIILQGLPADIYSLMNHHRSYASKSGGKEGEEINSQTADKAKRSRGFPDGQVVQDNHSKQCCLFQYLGLDTYAIFDCNDISTAQAVLMANISNYGSDVISEVPHSETYLNDIVNQGVQVMQDFEQPPAMDFTDNEYRLVVAIIFRYSRYLEETQQVNVQETHLQGQQDSMILSVIEQMSEQMSEQMINHMDDMITGKLSFKEQINLLEQNLSKQMKEKECLLQTFTFFKSESKEKEDKYMENEIDLEKKIKELDNILFKVGQSAQTVHMLTKPHAFYDNIHKQALDGIVMSDKHVAMPVIDDEETLILEEEIRSKMSEKQRIQRLLNISHKPIDYEKLNRLTKDFRKRFTPQQELSAEQAFWLGMSNPTSKPSDVLPVKIEVPNELPKISLVNESLKKLKFHLAKFNNVVKIRTTSNAHT
ncbi:hypothetical protein Tco_0631882 [Tanacetum coccineum]